MRTRGCWKALKGSMHVAQLRKTLLKPPQSPSSSREGSSEAEQHSRITWTPSLRQNRIWIMNRQGEGTLPLCPEGLCCGPTTGLCQELGSQGPSSPPCSISIWHQHPAAQEGLSWADGAAWSPLGPAPASKLRGTARGV